MLLDVDALLRMYLQGMRGKHWFFGYDAASFDIVEEWIFDAQLWVGTIKQISLAKVGPDANNDLVVEVCCAEIFVIGNIITIDYADKKLHCCPKKW